MDMLEKMRRRRSIRKYTDKRIERSLLEGIMNAGLYAPNPGGRQGTRIIMLDDPAVIEQIGVVNADCENRSWKFGVSKEQPSIIDDLSIKSGFYGCTALAMVCIARSSKNAVNAIGSAFVSAQNMVMAAYDMGVASCIVGRAEATFSKPGMQELLDKWGLDSEYMPMVFVCLGYIDGEYPDIKPVNEGRTIFVSDRG